MLPPDELFIIVERPEGCGGDLEQDTREPLPEVICRRGVAAVS